MTTLGLIGAGRIGGQLARLGVVHGHDVVLSNSRGPDSLRDLVAELGPRARAATPAEAAAAGDLVVVTIPFREIDTLPAAELAGKVVIDTNNYYPQRDGNVAALDDESMTVSELLQAHLPESKVVKAFNHVFSSLLTSAARPAGAPDRLAIAVAGNDASARAVVGALIGEFGFDVVDLGPLAEGWRIQRDTPGYGASMDAVTLRAALASATRQRNG